MNNEKYPDYSNLKGILLIEKSDEIKTELKATRKHKITDEEYYAELRKYKINPDDLYNRFNTI